MNASKLNEWLALAGNAGVIAGIVFLAAEISQNTEMMQSQTRDAMTEKQMDWYMAIGTNEFATGLFFELARNGIAQIEQGDPRVQAFNFIAMANIRMWENEWYQYQKQLYEEDEFLTRSSLWPGVLAQPGFRAIWEDQKNAYAPDFREYLDEKLMELLADL